MLTQTARSEYARYSPAPSIRHQAVALNIAAALLQHVESRKLGRVLHAPCDVVLSRNAILRPDVLFVEKKRRGIIGRMNLRGVPDLVIDILSRETRERELRAQRKIYAQYEVPEYWAVDPDADTVETLLWSELGYVSAGNYGRRDRLSSPLLPDLDLPLSRVFKNPDQGRFGR